MVAICVIMIMCFTSACKSVENEKTIVEEPKKVLVIFSDKNNESQEIRAVLENAEKAFGVKWEVEVLENIDKEIEKPDFVEKNDLIVFIGSECREYLSKLSTNNTEKHFAFIGGIVPNDNVKSILFKEQEGAFLLGIIAGERVQDGTITFIGGKTLEFLKIQEEGFWKGVNFTQNEKDSIKKESCYLSGFNDISGAYNALKNIDLSKNSAIFSRCGEASLGIYTFIHENNEKNEIMLLGDSIDENQFKSKFKEIECLDYSRSFSVALEVLLEELKDGEVSIQGIFEVGIFQDAISINEDSLPESIKVKVQSVIEKIKSGEIVVDNLK